MDDIMNSKSYALITGASSGIGECFTRALAKRRMNLALVARSQEKLETLAQELRNAHGIQTEVIAMDLAQPGAAQNLMQTLKERQIEVDLLINNAGAGAQGRFWEISLERQEQILRLNVQTLLELCHLLIPAMIQNRRGAIINVSSTASFQPLPYTSVYSASKSFVTHFSMGLAEELRPYGIQVVTLCPGPTETNFFAAGEYRSMRFRGGMQSPEKVASAGLAALDHGGGLTLCSLRDNFLLFTERFIPRSWVARIVAGMFKP